MLNNAALSNSKGQQGTSLEQRDTADDASLVRRFQRGENAAFEQIVRRHQDAIYRLALVSLHSSSHASDATQEVFLRAFTGLKRFRFKAQLFTWLFQTLKNVCREYNRKQPAPMAYEQEQASDENITEVLDQERCSQRIRQLVAQLPERQRDVVLLRIFEDLSVQETAQAMGCRAGTVKALLHKAIAQLRQKNSLAMLVSGDSQ